MYEISPLEDVDIELFKKQYVKNQYLLNKLVILADKTEKQLDDEIKHYSYEECCELIEFLKMCKQNYITLSLISALITCCHEKENDAFLDLYIAYQENKIDSWLESCLVSKKNMLVNFFENNEDIADTFPNLVDLIVKNIENYHI